MIPNKHVLITGASSGLGEALARRFAKEKAHLTLSARRLDRLKDLKCSIAEEHKDIDILIVPADVGSKDACRALVDRSVSHFGHLDVFVANAGLGMWSRFRDIKDPDDLQEIMQINYMGVAYGLFYALPYLRKTNGSFVAISSIQGVIPVIYHTGYVASKFAVNGLIETIRMEEPDVHFLLAQPSWISGTELRAHAVSGEGNDAIRVKKGHGKHATSTIDCADQIVAALRAKKREVFIPKKYHCAPILRDLFKSTFDRVVTSKVSGQLED